MNPDEKINKIKELEQQFLTKIEEIKKDYQARVRELVAEAEKQKIESLKKDLGV